MAVEERKERLETLVAAYGTDIRRWPLADRSLAPTSAEINAIAGAREVAALDRLLCAAATDNEDGAANMALMNRILASVAECEAPRSAAAKEEVAALPARACGSAWTRLHPVARRSSYQTPAAAAALMAASLAFGSFVGTLQTTQSTVARIVTLAGLDLAASATSAAFEGDFLAQDEEDIL